MSSIKRWLKIRRSFLYVAVISLTVGGLLAALLVCALVPKLVKPHFTSVPATLAEQVFPRHGAPSPDDARWQLLIRDITAREMAAAEVQLRDHFVLLLSLGGIAMTIILAASSMTLARRDEKVLELLHERKKDVQTLKKEAEAILEKIREHALESGRIRSNLEEKFKELGRQNDTLEPELSGLKSRDALSEEGNTPQQTPSSVAAAPHHAEPSAGAAERSAASPEVAPLTPTVEASPPPGDATPSPPSWEDAPLDDLRRAADQGTPEAQFQLGIRYYNGESGVVNDETQAFYWFSKAAEQGHRRAQHNLGFMYKLGIGVEKDEVQAASWYKKAAEQGYHRAQTNLGFMYQYGKGVDKDEAQAAFWFAKAAAQGNKNALLEMSELYYTGTGVPESYVDAYVFLTLYKSKGVDDGRQRKVDNLQTALRERLTQEQLAEAQRTAKALWEKFPKK